jgi:hypothetical protein
VWLKSSAKENLVIAGDHIYSMAVVLRNIMLLQRNVPLAAKYYSEGVGLQLRLLTETWAELDAGTAVIALKKAEGWASCLETRSVVTDMGWLHVCSLCFNHMANLLSMCREAYLTTGYSPFLSLEVPNVQNTVQRLISMGAEMDGPIRFGTSGRIAAVRNPDGHMMSLFEQAQ